MLGEWDPQVRGVAQHLVAMAVEPVEQVDVLGSSARKQGQSAFGVLRMLHAGNPWMPVTA